MTRRISASPPSALPATVNDQHLHTTTPEGINSYQDVPITIPKEEGRMSPTVGVGRAGEDRKGILSGGSVCLGQSSALAGEETSASPLGPVGP